MTCLQPLPNVGVFLHGPRWRRHFDVREVAVMLGERPQMALLYDFEADVRERVLVELRHDVAAMWSDPREQLGLR